MKFRFLPSAHVAAPQGDGNGRNQKQTKSDLNKTKTMAKSHSQKKHRVPSQIVVSDDNSQILRAIQNTNSRMDKLEKEIVALKKNQLFDSAIRNAEYNSFEYHVVWIRKDGTTYSTGNQKNHSKDLVRKILFAFQSGTTFAVELGSLRFIHRGGLEDFKEPLEDFYDQVSFQIHELTGVKPKSKMRDDGTCTLSFQV